MNTETSLSFAAFGLSDAVLAALARKGFTAPSSIQALALPRLLADEGHLVAKARTGTGKTAAFGIPLVERLTTAGKAPRALILAPTRELALQVSQEIRSLAGGQFPRVCAVYGGASMGTQLRDLSRGVEIVVGTPGRVMDHLERGSLDLTSLEWLILDEADEMLDMGFLEDVETIMEKANPNRRVALFSATMPAPILKVVRDHIGAVDIVEDKAAVDEKPAVDQFYIVLRREDKLEALRRIIDSAPAFHGLVFCATKAETDEVARRLVEGGYSAEALHGDLSQEARERTLRRFRTSMTTIVVATDVAARGIDVERLSHVINWDLPNDRESYVHRIGRTGRAGRRGTAISFVAPIARGRVIALSRSLEPVLGAPINKMNAPDVESVMEASRIRVKAAIFSAAGFDPKQAVVGIDGESGDAENGLPAALLAEKASAFEPNDPRAVLASELIDAMGPRAAIEALVAAAYGDSLDPARYKQILEPEDRFRRDTRPSFRDQDRGFGKSGGGYGRRHEHEERPYERGPRVAPRVGGDSRSGPDARVYVGVGRSHGASARDVAGLLMRATGVPGRLVDSIDVREFCAFATLPAEAARRAYEYARRDPALPSIRPAAPVGEKTHS
ncbi:MAG: DEAD/DEAH box helicase [Treponemataceae bacterium]